MHRPVCWVRFFLCKRVRMRSCIRHLGQTRSVMKFALLVLNQTYGVFCLELLQNSRRRFDRLLIKPWSIHGRDIFIVFSVGLHCPVPTCILYRDPKPPRLYVPFYWLGPRMRQMSHTAQPGKAAIFSAAPFLGFLWFWSIVVPFGSLESTTFADRYCHV